MTQAETQAEREWLAVIGRSLAFLCLHAADLRDKDLLRQANLLDDLGLSKTDVAKLLGTTEESIRVTRHRARKKKGRSGGNKASKKKRSPVR
jgi:DNA-directed RNA polymerase specialized sigma24 family protein